MDNIRVFYELQFTVHAEIYSVLGFFKIEWKYFKYFLGTQFRLQLIHALKLDYAVGICRIL